MSTTHIVPTEFDGQKPVGTIRWFVTNGLLWGIDSKGQTFRMTPSAPKEREPGLLLPFVKSLFRRWRA